MLKSKQLKYIYVYIYMYTSLETVKDCNLLHDRHVLSTGRTPHYKEKTATLLTITKTWL